MSKGASGSKKLLKVKISYDQSRKSQKIDKMNYVENKHA